ncbi:MAG: hypothetical protein ABR573_12065 [Candidatus Dormibacteria bacterium]
MSAPVLLLGSSVGDLQTIFYLVLVSAMIVGLALLFLGVGYADLVGFAREPGHRGMAALVAVAFTLALLFIGVVGVSILVTVSRHG